MLSTQKRNKLGKFIGRNRSLESRHLLTAVLNLVRDLGSRELLANIGQRGAFLSALSQRSVAIRAAFVAEEDRSGFF